MRAISFYCSIFATAIHVARTNNYAEAQDALIGIQWCKDNDYEGINNQTSPGVIQTRYSADSSFRTQNTLLYPNVRFCRSNISLLLF